MRNAEPAADRLNGATNFGLPLKNPRDTVVVELDANGNSRHRGET